MQPPNGYGQPDQPTISYKPQRQYSDPRNNPANWNRGGLSTPSSLGGGYQQSASQSLVQAPLSYGGQMDFSKNSGSGWGMGQAQIQPTGSVSPVSIDPVLQEQIRRKKLLQQQQLLSGQMGQGQIPQQIQPTRSSTWQLPGAQAESRYPQNVTQPFPVQNPWQQNVPQNFNQGTEYNPFVRRW
jgi:hypothetical protein